MILCRHGNKKRLADKIIDHFPDNIKLFVDLFFGTGSISWKMIGRVDYIIGNDFNDDVYNLYNVVKNNLNEFKQEVGRFPVHENLLTYWKKKEGENNIEKAVRFLFMSNFTLFGTGNTLQFSKNNNKRNIEERVNLLYEKIKYIQFQNCDFRKSLKKIHLNSKKGTFVYADPPYLSTTNNYGIPWKYQDSTDLFKILVESGFLFAISEFKNPKIFELIESYQLQYVEIIKRYSIQSKLKKTEILIMNY